MGIVDAFSREDRVEVKFSNFYGLMKQAAQYEIAMNAVNCDVPHAYIRETMTGKKEDHQEALLEATDTITPPVAKMGVVEVKFDGEEFRRILEKAFEERPGSTGRNRRGSGRQRRNTDTGRGRKADRGKHSGSRGTGAGKHGKGTAGNNRGKYSGSGRGNHLQRVKRRTKHGSSRNYLFYRGSSRRHGWPCGLRRTPCEPE